jgi:hypothetical protein
MERAGHDHTGLITQLAGCLIGLYGWLALSMSSGSTVTEGSRLVEQRGAYEIGVLRLQPQVRLMFPPAQR